jgi:hypothetical protein
LPDSWRVLKTRKTPTPIRPLSAAGAYPVCTGPDFRKEKPKQISRNFPREKDNILAAVAEHEREMISERTKAALRAAKARGRRLGNPQLAKAAKRGTAAVKANAKQFAANVLPIIEEIERAGFTSHNAIAAKLNERNVRTARGGKWTHVQVGAVLRPFEASAAAAE